jgi:hypothetical protein
VEQKTATKKQREAAADCFKNHRNVGQVYVSPNNDCYLPHNFRWAPKDSVLLARTDVEKEIAALEKPTATEPAKAPKANTGKGLTEPVAPLAPTAQPAQNEPGPEQN